MSDSLFEVHRIWEVWPNLFNHQALRDLFRQVSSPSCDAGWSQGVAYSIDNVFVFPGHVFVTTIPRQRSHDSLHQSHDSLHQSHDPSQAVTETAQLYGFSCIPLREEPESCDNNTPYLLPLNDGCKKVVNVIDITTGDVQRIIVIQDCGSVSMYQFNSATYLWEMKDESLLSAQPPSAIHHAVLHVSPNSNLRSLIVCEEPAYPNTKHSSRVIVRSFDAQDKLKMGDPRVVLVNAPRVSFLEFGQGVCFLPACEQYPNGLLLFWVPESNSTELTALVWNSSQSIPHTLKALSSSSASPPTFQSLTLGLVGVWAKVSAKPSLVTMAVHPLTRQLLALASDGSLYNVIVRENGTVTQQILTRLSDFTQRNSAISDIFSCPLPYNKVHLFCTLTYYGYCLRGEIRIYDSFTGEFVWDCDDHEGAGCLLWTTPTPPGFCGVYGNSGVWLIRSQKAADQAQFMATTLFPITTNADETTPGEFLDSGQLLAAKLCHLWDLKLLATKFTLEGVLDIVKAEIDVTTQTGDCFLPQLPKELLSLLSEDHSLQNPALLVALLAEYPSYRQQLGSCLNGFLDRYHNKADGGNLSTPLNADIVPMLREYLELCEEFDRSLKEPATSASSGNDVQDQVYRLLKNSEAATVTHEEVTASSRALLHSLCQLEPTQALVGIRDFLGVGDFKKAVEELEAGHWFSDRNWRGILATESVGRVQRSYIHASTNHLPLFEETCRLLYLFQPSELLPFVTFAQLARDYQAQGDSAFARKCRNDFFFHRALDALPMFVSLKATPTSREAIQARCKLLLQSDYLNVQMNCLQLLLCNEMWSDAITLVEETKIEETHNALFHCVLFNLSKGGVLHEYLDRVWNIIPKKFNLFDFFSMLRTAVQQSPDRPVIEDPDSSHLTISSVSSKVLDLLKQTDLDQLKP